MSHKKPVTEPVRNIVPPHRRKPACLVLTVENESDRAIRDVRSQTRGAIGQNNQRFGPIALAVNRIGIRLQVEEDTTSRFQVVLVGDLVNANLFPTKCLIDEIDETLRMLSNEGFLQRD